MDDFRVKVGFFGHFKTRRLERELGAAAVLGLQRLWEYCTTPSGPHDGDLSSLDDDDIEAIAEWSGDRGAFVSGLRRIKFLDGKKIHQFEEHQPFVANFVERSERSRNAVGKRWAKRKNTGSIPDVYEPNTPFPSPIPLPSPTQEITVDLESKNGSLGNFTKQLAAAGICIQLGRLDRERFSKLHPVEQYEIDHALSKASGKKAGAGYVLSVIEGERIAAKEARAMPGASPRKETNDERKAREHNEWCERELSKQLGGQHA